MRWLIADARIGLRGLWKNPAYALAALTALALGIGANTAIFSVVNAVLLRPLPFANPERLVFIRVKSTESVQGSEDAVSLPDYMDYRQQSSAFENLAAIKPGPATGAVAPLTSLADHMTAQSILEGGAEPEFIATGEVSYNFFETLGLTPIRGRFFTRQDEGPSPARVTVVSYEFWQRRFGGDPSILGRQLMVNGYPMTVVGILGPGASFPASAELWYPLTRNSATDLRSFRPLELIGRLNGLPLASAQADADRVSRELARVYPATDAGRSIQLIPLRDALLGDVRPGLLMLLGAAGFVLLIACANVANLQLVRAIARRREMSIRLALGASRSQIVRQLLTESLMLALGGGLAGLLVAFWGLRLVFALRPMGYSPSVSLNPLVLAFAFAVSLIAGIIFGLAPAAETVNTKLAHVLKEGGRGISAGGQFLRSVLVVGEIALALVLLAGASLMIESFTRLERVRPGFNASHVLTMAIKLPAGKYPTPARMTQYFKSLLDRVRGLPGVESAGTIFQLPLGGNSATQSLRIEGQPPGSAELTADAQWLSNGAIETLQVPLLRGRLFTDREALESSSVTLINAEFARRYFHGEDPVGRYIDLGASTPSEHGHLQIVGVLGNVRHRSLDSPEIPLLYHPSLAIRSSYLLVRTARDPLTMADAVRAQVTALDPSQMVADVHSLDDVVDAAKAEPRFRTDILGVFAALALLLAALGIYGVVAYAVSQRSRDIGIRLALGAQPRQVLFLVLRQGLFLALAGVAIGTPSALVLARLIRSMLFEVSPFSPLTYSGITVSLVAVALAASYLPARRATRVEPVEVLRYE